MKKVKLYGVELEINELSSTCDTNNEWLKEGDEYWHIGSSGSRYGDIWINHTIDFNRKARGNCYRTEQEAINANNLYIATTKVLARLRELEKGEPVDWGDGEQCKYTPKYLHRSIQLNLDLCWTTQTKSTKFYSTDKQAWVQVLKEMPKEVELMVRGE